MRTLPTKIALMIACYGMSFCVIPLDTAQAQQLSQNEIRTLTLKAQSGQPTPDIVHQLAKTNSAVPALLAIAIKPGVDFDNRTIAISELSKLKSNESTTALAQLLVPQNSQGIRLQVADALMDSPCGAQCVRSILFYLYRLSAEERTELFVPHPTPELKKDFDAGEAQIISTLHKVLSQHQGLALDALITVYGVGTEQPSHFGLRMMRELDLRAGCDWVLSSNKVQHVTNGPERADTETTVAALACR